MSKTTTAAAKKAAAAKAAKALDHELTEPRDPADKAARAPSAAAAAVANKAVAREIAAADKIAADKVAADTHAANAPRDTSAARKNAAPPPGPERRVPVPRGRPRHFRDEGPERSLGALIRVRAFAVGFVDNVRRREGDVFDVHEAEFSDKWMETVDGSTPKSITGPKQALVRHHDQTMAERSAQRGTSGPDRDPLGTEALGRRA